MPAEHRTTPSGFSTPAHSSEAAMFSGLEEQVVARAEHERLGGLADYVTGYRPTDEERAALNAAWAGRPP